MGQPVPELVPVLVMRCPVPVLAICAFGYLHIHDNVSFVCCLDCLVGLLVGREAGYGYGVRGGVSGVFGIEGGW
jgi:hypothetical protein